MTTIAARDGVLAGDGKETDEEMVVSRRCRKIFRLKDGRLVGFSGDSEPAMVVYDAMRKGQAIPEMSGCTGLMIDTKGAIWLYEGKVWRRHRVQYYAIGSGAYFAFAAMMAGADAVKACSIGADLDPHSGGRIMSLKLKKPSGA